MKKIITLIAVSIFAFGTMMANWQPSDMNATRLDKEGSNGQVQMKTLRTDDGKIILTWLRGERVDDNFSYQLHLQVFDANGNAMFGDEGIIVCDKRTRTWTTDYGVALAPNGDILMAYTDIRNDPVGDFRHLAVNVHLGSSLFLRYHSLYKDGPAMPWPECSSPGSSLIQRYLFHIAGC